MFTDIQHGYDYTWNAVKYSMPTNHVLYVTTTLKTVYFNSFIDIILLSNYSVLKL